MLHVQVIRYCFGSNRAEVEFSVGLEFVVTIINLFRTVLIVTNKIDAVIANHLFVDLVVIA